MKKVILSIITCCLLVACNDATNKPEHLIAEPEMEEILYNVALLYGMQSTITSKSDSISRLEIKAIFEKYDIDSVTFVANNRYYIGLDNNVYFDMQTRIAKRLEEERTVIDSLIGKTDSREELVKLSDVKVIKDTLMMEKLPTDSVLSDSKKTKVVKPKVELQKSKLQKVVKLDSLKLK